MKLQIDTEAKTIKLEQSAKLTEIISALKKLFPNDEWKEYSFEALTVINNWNNPIYIDRWHNYPYWYNPYPILVGGGGTYIGGSGNSGTFTTNAANVNTCTNFEISN